MEQRKSDHIRIALQSQVGLDEHDARFNYEPMLQAHPEGIPQIRFLGRILKAPLWVSSMTGGTVGAYQINSNLARACREFGMGMGLGSCRTLLKDETHLKDFAMRDLIGNDLPFFANLGIVQVEQLVNDRRVSLVHDMIKKLSADGLIIHVNPLQEWFQPEGDRLSDPPIDTIKRFLDTADYPVIVKEVGQGIGPLSLKALFDLPLAAVEFAAFGGTNFARAELLRGDTERQFLYEPYTRIGETAYDMAGYVNQILLERGASKAPDVIVSGGIKNFLDGYYQISRVKTNAVYGQASAFLQHAIAGYEQLRGYCLDQINGLMLAYAYLKVV